MELSVGMRRFCSMATELLPSEWSGLKSWRMMALLDERRHWGNNGPEQVAMTTPFSSLNSASSLAEWGALVLATPHPESKAMFTHQAYKLWCNGTINSVGAAPPLDFPARPEKPLLVHPRKVPKAKNMDITSNVYMLHNLAHIELNAVDLAWDTVVRFSSSSHELDTQFFTDFVHVADDESRHFSWCQQRLKELGSSYGQVPAHNLLWKDCQKTSGALDARLAVIPMVQEARGLDAGPRLVEKLQGLGDVRSADIVQQISKEELAHVAVGVSWFLDVCKRLQCDPAARFKELMQTLSVELRGPFNHSARAAAGLPRSWYDTSIQPKIKIERASVSSCLPEICERLAFVVSNENVLAKGDS